MHIKGFPTIKVFDYGLQEKREYNLGYDYGGNRDAAGLVELGAKMAELAGIEMPIHELWNHGIYLDNCTGHSLCLLTFLPSIYDSSSKERKEYIKTLQEAAKLQKMSTFNWFWLQAGDQPELEQ